MFVIEFTRKCRFEAVLAVTMATLLATGCAVSDPASFSNSNYNPNITLAFSSDPNLSVSSSNALPCGDPVGWTDVQIVWIEPEADLDEKLTQAVGRYSLQPDEWLDYWFSGPHTRAVRKARQDFARKGCNLLVIEGDDGVPRMERRVRPELTGPAYYVMLIRWGSSGGPIR